MENKMEKYMICGEIKQYEFNKTIGTRILEACEKFSDNIAVAEEGKEYTYTELKALLSWMMMELKRQGIQKGDRVAVAVSNTAFTIVQILAIVLLGATYIPIHENDPEKRKAYIRKDSGAKLLHRNDAEAHSWILPNDSKDVERMSSAETVYAEDSLETPCYAIYTSGTTGVPKGVLVGQEGVINLCLWYRSQFDIGEGSKVLSLNSMSFDASVKNIFAPLFCGAAVIVNLKYHSNPKRLLEYIENKKVTHINGTPGLVAEIVETARQEEYQSLESLQCIITGGERFVRGYLYDLYRKKNKRFLIGNVYGPTEAVSVSTVHAVTEEELRDADRDIPIGCPIDRKKVCIRSGSNLIHETGKKGELLIGGMGIAREYIGRPELTQSKFIQIDGQTFYCSGDLVYLDSEGKLHYVGREDSQIKRNGYRIELDEISKVIEQLPEISKCCSFYSNDTIWSVYQEQNPCLEEKIIAYIKATLPEFMHPNRIMKTEDFPYTQNGKIDWNKLMQRYRNIKKCGKEEKNRIQKKVCEVWVRILNHSELSIHDNFFDVGGNSLRLFQMSRLLEQEIGIKVDPLDMMEQSSIVGISKFIVEQMKAQEEERNG